VANEKRSLIRQLVVALVLASLVMAWGLATRWNRIPARTDHVALLRHHNAGIGHMERQEYLKGIDSFEKVVELDPGWLPGRVNLGIALLCRSRLDPNLSQRARQIFEDILQENPDNPHANFCLGLIAFDSFKDFKELEQAARLFERVSRIDPRDADVWSFLARCQVDDEKKRVSTWKKPSVGIPTCCT
jgi:tetratricopeptide (TPR) repeat protein